MQKNVIEKALESEMEAHLSLSTPSAKISEMVKVKRLKKVV
jgi:hypothetical protein